MVLLVGRKLEFRELSLHGEDWWRAFDDNPQWKADGLLGDLVYIQLNLFSNIYYTRGSL